MRQVKGGRYRVLSSEQVYDIHSASLEVLERTGITVKAEEALKLLDEAGAIVDYKSGRVRLPEHLVKESIRKAPSRVRLCSRDGKSDLRLSGKNVYLGTGGAATHVLDLDTGERREITREDLGLLVRLADALKHTDFVVSPAYPS